MSTSYSNGSLADGAAIAGEGTLVIEPKYRRPDLRYPVQFVHGAGSDALYCLSPLGNQNTLTQMVAAEGYSATSGENGGPQTWGNLTSLRGVDAHYARGQTLANVKTGKTALISGSMGGLISMNWAAANRAKVSCIVSVIPVCNVTDIVTNNREGYAQFANSAYAGGWSEATYGAGHNPFTLSQAGKLAGIPMLFFYGLTDKLCTPTWPEQMKQHAGNNLTLVPLQSGHDYDSYAAVNQPMIVDFLNTYNV